MGIDETLIDDAANIVSGSEYGTDLRHHAMDRLYATESPAFEDDTGGVDHCFYTGVGGVVAIEENITLVPESNRGDRAHKAREAKPKSGKIVRSPAIGQAVIFTQTIRIEKRKVVPVFGKSGRKHSNAIPFGEGDQVREKEEPVSETAEASKGNDHMYQAFLP
jgi:hypothetical protein